MTCLGHCRDGDDSNKYGQPFLALTNSLWVASFLVCILSEAENELLRVN